VKVRHAHHEQPVPRRRAERPVSQVMAIHDPAHRGGYCIA
jgi:hypothetical protein